MALNKPKTKKNKPRKASWLQSIGPVENLESYVKADWWRQIFNSNYLRTDGDVVEDNRLTEIEIDMFLHILQLEKENSILDLCCGQGRHTLELARRGYVHLTGLDRSHYLINRAKMLIQKEGLQATFKEGDARKLPFPADSFDCVIIAGNSFGYFESAEDDITVLKEIGRVLKPSGKVLIDITDGSYMKLNYEPRGWEWIDKNYFVCRERSLSEDQARLISREVITHVKKGVIADQFYAERLYSRESIQHLLQETGFHLVQSHNDIITDSQRDQDLGMMARRILVTGSIHKQWSPISKKRTTTRSIVVVMGDPRKRDIVKPSGTFDKDDFFTIKAMKEALAQLKDYRFSYYDRHDTLISNLQNNRKKIDFVLNLCDEGFNNEATKELHIPSLLEILDIPYSGGNPQCLAYCYDKSLVRGVSKEMDIPIPRAFIINPEDTNFIDLPISFPVIVKPNFGDSSFGINQKSVCYSVENLETSLLELRKKLGYEKPILVEELLMGDDISVGIIGNPPESYMALPIIKEDYSSLPSDLPPICGYEAKWDPESPYGQVDSILVELPEETERFLIASCVKLFERLECRDYARFDWRLDRNKTPRLLEVNPNPGWCWDGHLAKMAKFAGMSYADMLEKIIQSVLERINQ